MAEDNGYISLSQFSRKINAALSDPDLFSQWITCEINSININRYSGHCYLELIEKNASGETVASQKGTIWKSCFQRINNTFVQETGQELQVGMKILALASVSFHSVYGLSVNITSIDPSYSLGENERKRRETIDKLKKDGIWDMNRMVEIPMVISRLAVISSPTAAGYGDFCRQTAESGLNISITLFESLVQGNQAEQSIIDSLSKICDRADEFDAIVIIRGGGATGDMDCFDGYMVCSAIAQMPIPVITGIGHDRDTSIADMVAALSLKTPTAVAVWIIDRINGYLSTMENLTVQIINNAQKILLGMWNQIELYTSRVSGMTSEILSEKKLQLSQYQNRINILTGALSVRESNRITRLEENIRNRTTDIFHTSELSMEYTEKNLSIRWDVIRRTLTNQLETRQQLLAARISSRYSMEKNRTESLRCSIAAAFKSAKDKFTHELLSTEQKITDRSYATISIKAEKLSSLQQLLISHDPSNVLSRGFAIVRKNGKVLPDSEMLQKGDNIEIEMRDSKVCSIVGNIKKK